MAPNPYASFNASADPYTNGETLKTTSSKSPSRSATATPGSTDDYDPYGDRYGTPPLKGASASRERLPPARPGGYGGFYNNSNASGGTMPPSSHSSQQDLRDQYRNRSRDGAGSSGLAKRPSEESTRFRSDRSEPISSAPEVPRSRAMRRPQPGEPSYSAGVSGGFGSAMNNREVPGPPPGGGNASQQIDDVLAYIQTQWNFMAEDKCVPVQVALQFMDSSSLGRANQYPQFQTTHQQLQRALRAIVNEHHQGFISSIGTFHQIQSSIQASQARLRHLKESLAEAKVGIATTRPELKGLAATSQSYEETLQALSSIESLRLVTDKLEARISEKRFLSAIDVLQDALRLLRKPELEGIGALSELRTYLTNQETSLTDILIEELHSHLYLKSPYCQDRWKAHVKEISHGISSESADSHASSIQPLYQFLDDLDCRESMVEDATRNPENDSFYYIQLLVESLNKMGSLDEAVNAIVQRLPVELFKVVDKSNKEVVQRHPDYKQNDHSARNCQGIGISEDDDRAIVLCDLLWTLYAKFEAIAESHRVFHDVVLGITKREKIEDIISLTGSFRELWMIYQNEIRSILHDYLATDSNLEHMNRSRHLQTDVYKRGQRNKENTIFKLADTDLNSDTYETDLSDLDAILKASVPGLVSDSKHQTVATSDDKVHLVDGAATGHKLLVEPSVFNMGIMLPPSLAFLQRLKDIVPPEPPLQTGKLTSFLDDFLVNVFLPQLEETLIKYSNRAINEADAFQEDPRWAEVSRRPILKGCSAFYNLITVFCRMLDNLPHDQAFTRLIMNQMSTYYHRSYEWFETLTSRTQSSESYGPSMKASAIIANDPSEVHDVVQKLWTNGDHTLIDKEIGLLILRTNETPLTLSDVISDRKVIKSLCLLYTSMRWLASNISHLRSITQEDADSSRNSRGGTRGRSWTLITKNITLTKVKGPVKLPMTQEKVAAFDSIMSSYQELAGKVLLTLHLESRCQIVQALSEVLSPANAPYVLEQVVSDPDPRLLTLNADLVSYDETTAQYLGQKELSFLRTGLAQLVDTYLVINAGVASPMNTNGCGRMQLNILVLQQNLKNIELNSSLSRAAHYYDLFTEGIDAILKKAKEKESEKQFSYDELKTMVELCFSEQVNNPERGVSTVAKRNMGDKLLELSEAMWQS